MKGKNKKRSNTKTGIESIRQYIREQVKIRGIEHLSDILKEAKDSYSEEIQKYGKDVEQSWKPFKGNLLEEIILEAILDEVDKLGLKVIRGKDLEKRKEDTLGECLGNVKRSIVVDYGEFGMHLPDADLIIYDPRYCKAVAIISSKASLRERIAQTGYWRIKLKSSPATRNVKVFFITLDEDGDLVVKKPTKKSRAIAEVDTDGTFVITLREIQESGKVKMIDKLLDALKDLLV